MKDLTENPFNPDRSGGASSDEIKAENEVLKLKLEMEFGMNMSDKSTLDPAIENQWLTHIYNFENQYKNAKRIKVFDYLDRPSFAKITGMKRGEMAEELQRILRIMEAKGIVLDRSDEYEESILYRFITEELFEHEIDHVAMDGFVRHFIYEEFHPNHEKDLRRYTEEFIELLLRRKLDEFDSRHFAHQVSFRGSEFDSDKILLIIKTFQDAHDSFEVRQFQIHRVSFELEVGLAEVKAAIRYTAKGNGDHTFEGNVTLNFIFQLDFWYINGFQLPGLVA